MAVPVARVHLAMAHAALPALLPTPPEWKMAPLLPTPPCAVILPNSSPPKPGRADADERWDARKNATNKKSPPSKPGRADAVERWDAHKITRPAAAASPASSGSSQRSPDGRSSSASSRASSSERWDSNKRAISRASSSAAARWDAQKKPRPTMQPAEELDDDCNSSTGSNDNMEMDSDKPQPRQRAIYAAPGFVASPEPSMLPFPAAFMVRAAA